MSVYCFKLLQGYILGGIDRAIATRAKLLADSEEPVRFVFTEIPRYDYTKVYMDYGLKEEQMMSIHQFLSGHDTIGFHCRVDDKLKQLKVQGFYDEHVKNSKTEIALIKNGSLVAKMMLTDTDEDIFYGIYYFNQAYLIRYEHYTDSLFYAISYYPQKNSDGKEFASEYRIVVYDKEGNNKYDLQPYTSIDGSYYPDGNPEIIKKFIKSLKLTEKDIVIIDQPYMQNYLSILFSNENRAKVYVVMHSGHYFYKNESPDHLYWNNEYYECFRNIDKVSRFIVSSEEQKKDLSTQLLQISGHVPDISVIPAGAVFNINSNDTDRKPFSLFTMSRMDPGKKIDTLIKAVCLAHKSNPFVSLDIYGSGLFSYENELRDLVKSLNADEYIHFMGLQNVDHVPEKYEVYLSASVMETLGLSMMEAVAGGCAMIALNSRYGSKLFTENNKNGYLIDFDIDEIFIDDNRAVNEMANRIVDIFASEQKLRDFQKYSYQIAKRYDCGEIKKLWTDALEGAL